MKANKEIEEDVLKVIEGFHRAYAEKNIEKSLSYFADDADLVAFGTDRDETDLGVAGIRRNLESDFRKEKNISIEMTWHSVSARGHIAWLAAEYQVHAELVGESMTFQARSTVVLEKREGRWLIVHTHVSNPRK